MNSVREIAKLKEKYKVLKNGKQVKPAFFKMITTENGYKLGGNICYKSYKTSMDYMHKIIGSYNFRRFREKKQEVLPFSSVIGEVPVASSSGYYYNLRDEIIDYVRTKKRELSNIYVGYREKTPGGKEAVRVQADLIKSEMFGYLSHSLVNQVTAYLLLLEIENSRNSDVCQFLFDTLFSLPCATFFELIRESKLPLDELVEDENGEIKLYDFRYFKRKFTKKGEIFT